MPSTKLAFFRYLHIDRMLRNKQRKYPSKEELLQACQEKYGVHSLSTIEKDIKAMREEFEAPIKYFRKHQGYAYTDPRYRFLGLRHLSEEEREALGFVEQLLEEFRDLPLFDSFSDAVDKVLDGIEITKNYQQSRHKKVWIDKSPYVKGTELLHNLISWVSEETVLKLVYKKHDAKELSTYNVHPYLLREHQNFWYLLGAVPEKQFEIRTFGIDRIQRVSPLPDDFVPPHAIDFDPAAHFAHCLGVTVYRDRKPEPIRLQFSPTMSKYVTANPMHHSQDVLEVKSDGTTTIALFLVVNPELRNTILSYGEHVQVLAPSSLADSIRQELERGARHYLRTTKKN